MHIFRGHFAQFKSGQGWAKPSFMAIFAHFSREAKNFDEKKFEKIDEKWQKSPLCPVCDQFAQFKSGHKNR